MFGCVGTGVSMVLKEYPYYICTEIDYLLYIIGRRNRREQESKRKLFEYFYGY